MSEYNPFGESSGSARVLHLGGVAARHRRQFVAEGGGLHELAQLIESEDVPQLREVGMRGDGVSANVRHDEHTRAPGLTEYVGRLPGL